MFTVEAPKDQRHGAEADRGGILSDDCGPGLQQVGEREVVEADHGDTVVEAQVLVVDTVGAGDSFMAGLLVGLGDAGLLGRRVAGSETADPGEGGRALRVDAHTVAVCALWSSRSYRPRRRWSTAGSPPAKRSPFSPP